MPTQTKTKLANYDASKYQGLERDTLIRVYRTMFHIAASGRSRNPAQAPEPPFLPD